MQFKLTKELRINNKLKIGGKNPFLLIAGPCVIENEKQTLSQAEKLLNICQKTNIPFIFKTSYDKANRTSLKSYRGPGLKKGLNILQKLKDTFEIPLLSDIHREEEIKAAAQVLDILQVPAFLCRQTDLILSFARTGKIVNLKKGQFLAPGEMKNIIEKIESVKNKKIILTERGTCFGYHNLVADMRSLVIMRKFGYPIIFDATHSLQLPGGKGFASDGQREFIPALSRAAAAAGCDGIFLEVHPDPDKAPCDGPNMLKLNLLPKLLQEIKEIAQLVKKKSKDAK